MGNKKANKVTDEYIDSLLELQREDYHSDLQSFEAYKEHEALMMKGKVEEYWDNLMEGHRLTIDRLTEPEDKKRVDECLKTIIELGTKAYEDEKMFVPVDLFEILYGIAINFFDEQKFEEAKKVLVFLTFLSPYLVTPWIAQGRVLEALQTPDLAIEAYKMAMFADPNNVEGYRNCIRCFLEAGKIEEAHNIADVGLQIGKDPASEFSIQMGQIKRYISNQGGK